MYGDYSASEGAELDRLAESLEIAGRNAMNAAQGALRTDRKRLRLSRVALYVLQSTILLSSVLVMGAGLRAALLEDSAVFTDEKVGMVFGVAGPIIGIAELIIGMMEDANGVPKHHSSDTGPAAPVNSTSTGASNASGDTSMKSSTLQRATSGQSQPSAAQELGQVQTSTLVQRKPTTGQTAEFFELCVNRNRHLIFLGEIRLRDEAGNAIVESDFALFCKTQEANSLRRVHTDATHAQRISTRRTMPSAVDTSATFYTDPRT